MQGVCVWLWREVKMACRGRAYVCVYVCACEVKMFCRERALVCVGGNLSVGKITPPPSLWLVFCPPSSFVLPSFLLPLSHKRRSWGNKIKNHKPKARTKTIPIFLNKHTYTLPVDKHITHTHTYIMGHLALPVCHRLCQSVKIKKWGRAPPKRA